MQNISRICMGKKPIVSLTYENERISIKNSLPYLKCVLRLSCVVHGQIYGLPDWSHWLSLGLNSALSLKDSDTAWDSNYSHSGWETVPCSRWHQYKTTVTRSSGRGSVDGFNRESLQRLATFDGKENYRVLPRRNLEAIWAVVSAIQILIFWILRNNADARRCSYFELGLPVVYLTWSWTPK